MPTSYAQSVSPVLEVILQLRPASVLDIGIGSGKYGVLCREYCDQWVGGTLERRTRIDGVEAHERYIGAQHRAVYDDIIVGDARNVVPTLNRNYDLALLIDVFEHLTPADGRTLLDALRPKAQSILVSVPVSYWAQGAEHGNEFERHLAHYDPAGLRALGLGQVWRVYGSWIALSSPRRVRLRPLLLRYALDALLPAGLIAAWRRLRHGERTSQ